MKKTKKFINTQRWGIERRGEESSGFQIQGDQELTAYLTLHGEQQDFMFDKHVRVDI